MLQMLQIYLSSSRKVDRYIISRRYIRKSDATVQSFWAGFVVELPGVLIIKLIVFEQNKYSVCSHVGHFVRNNLIIILFDPAEANKTE